LGSGFIEYRREWELAGSFAKLPAFPLHVDYELKNECNLRCPMCLYGQLPREPREMTKSEALSLIRVGAGLGQRSMGFGGVWEPLTSPFLAELVTEGRRQGLMDAMLNTNGLLLTRERGRELIEAGLTRLMISVDAASPEVYGRARPGGDFRLLENNILEFLATRQSLGRRLPLTRLSFCLTRHNELELPAFLRAWAGKVDFFSIQSYGRFSPTAPALWPKKFLSPPPGGRCPQPQQRLLIRANGQALPCCDLSGLSQVVGNWLESSLLEIWRGEAITTLRARLAGPKNAWPEVCQACQAKYA
jgi:radical SAM protein with 4Fe4S-binding SPASM domain